MTPGRAPPRRWVRRSPRRRKMTLPASGRGLGSSTLPGRLRPSRPPRPHPGPLPLGPSPPCPPVPRSLLVRPALPRPRCPARRLHAAGPLARLHAARSAVARGAPPGWPPRRSGRPRPLVLDARCHISGRPCVVVTREPYASLDRLSFVHPPPSDRSWARRRFPLRRRAPSGRPPCRTDTDMRLARRSRSPLQVTVSQPTLRTLRLTLDGELDATSRPLLRDVAGAVTLASPGDVEVDAAGLSFVDLRGLRALGDLWARLERAGRVTLVRSSRAVERLLLACVRAGLPVPLPAAARRPSLPGVDPSTLPPAAAARPSGAPALLLSDGPPLLAPTGTRVGGLATPPAEGHGRDALASLDLLGLGPVPGADMQVTERPEAIDPTSTEAEAPSDAD